MKHNIDTIHCKYYDELQDEYVYQSISELMQVGVLIDEHGNDLECVDDNLYVWDEGKQEYVELP